MAGASKPGVIRRLYDWTVHWAQTPYGVWALFVLAFAESSFFPIPPDVLLIALAVAIPKNSLKYAMYCSVGSILGGAFGYLLGWQFMGTIGDSIVAFYGYETQFGEFRDLFAQYDVWVVGIAGFSPIPYKIITITAGVVEANFAIFLLVSAISRSARFFLVGGLIYRFGPTIQPFIEKYLDWLAIAFTILLIGGFVVIKLLL
ncbi:MAG: YqaA family protein [Desulfatibacillaceae bacterium]